jgi:DNA repair exonuclease SbcCD ATPase subunit
MRLHDEIDSAERVVETAKGYIGEFFDNLVVGVEQNEMLTNTYKEYFEKTLLVAASTLDFCQMIGEKYEPSSESPGEDIRKSIQKLIVELIESISEMYSVLTVIDRINIRTSRNADSVLIQQEDSNVSRRCSFCGTNCKAESVVAGPSVYICSNCTRLACSVLGIALRE